MTAKKPFPEKLFVTRENEGEGDDEYLDVNHNTIEETAAVGEEITVAIYELTTVTTVRTKVEWSDKTA